MFKLNVGRESMERLIAFVRMQWHATKWHKTCLSMEQVIERSKKEGQVIANKEVRSSFKLRGWAPGYIMNGLVPPVPIMIGLVLPKRRVSGYKILNTKKKVGTARNGRFLDLANNFPLRVREQANYTSVLNLRLSMSFFLGLITFINMIPMILLDVEPSLVLQPEIVKTIKSLIIHEGCHLNNESCICIKNPNPPNPIVEDYLQRSLELTNAEKEKGITKAIAISVGTILIYILLNRVTTGNISDYNDIESLVAIITND